MTFGRQANMADVKDASMEAALLPNLRRQPKPSVVLAVAGFGAFLAFLDSTIVNVAFPSIRGSFPATSLSTLSWVLNAYNVVFAGFLVAAGRFADLLGRRRMFILGTLLFTLSSAEIAIEQYRAIARSLSVTLRRATSEIPSLEH